jgi:Concanavalin A-like lectin/glucanases superfamily
MVGAGAGLRVFTAAVSAVAMLGYGAAAQAAQPRLPDGYAVPGNGATAQAAQPTLPDGYAERVNHALRQGADHWGSQLIQLPGGATLENVAPLLVPANHGGPTVADSDWSYLPLTYPAPDPAKWNEQRDFSLHVADGSELLSQWSDGQAAQRVKFAVGADGQERFGSAEARAATPRLRDGYLPILINDYTDASGVSYERESFVGRLEPGGPLVSLLRFTASAQGHQAPATAHLRVSVQAGGVDRATAADHTVSVDGKTILAYSGDATWSAPALDYRLDLRRGPASVYLVIANQASAMPAVQPDGGLFKRTRDEIGDYWRELLQSGARVDVPEPYVANAMRNMLINNLVMGFNLTVGNGYESPSKTFAFVPEVASTVTSLGDFGYRDRFRANVEELINRGQGGGFFLTWERGIKLQTAATYYLQTNDGSLIDEHLTTFKDWLTEFARQRDEDPHGLLAKTRYGSDIPDPVYGIHHQAEAWRGMRDMGVALKLMGRANDAEPFLSEAQELRGALLAAIDQSKTVLPDGSIFVPIGLLDNAEQPYDRLTDTTRGSYWNLTMPYALATGLMKPGSALANGIQDYLYKHGSLFLGLTRFNLSGADPGVCNTVNAPAWPSAPGYKSSGIDQQYGYSLMRYLADAGQADRLDLSFYGMLGASFTPNTFIGGEGETLSPCPQLGEYYRSQYWPPLSPNNATFLEALRGLLLNDGFDDEGIPDRLDIAPATPRAWLGDGKRVGAEHMSTAFGPVSYEIESRLSHGYLTARIEPPHGRATAPDTVLHLRVPAGNRLALVLVDGRPVPFDAGAETVELGRPKHPVTVRAVYRHSDVRSADHAQVTTVDTPRTLLQPGEQADLDAEVELLGERNVSGWVDVQAPAGWRVSRERLRFSDRSDGRFTWQRLSVNVKVPESARPGDYVIRFAARPDDGPAESTDLHVRVAVPAATGYADLVRQQHPVGYWRLDEPSTDAPAADASGSGNVGAFQGNVSSAAGAIADDADTAMRLDGGFVEIPDSASLSLHGPYTLEAWVKDVAAGSQSIIEKYDGGDCLPSSNGYVLRLLEGNKLQAINVGQQQGFASGPTARSVAQQQWHHLASVYDGTTLSLYLDGQLQSSTAVSQPPLDGRGSLKLGARGDDAAMRFAGWLDEVAVYNKALPADELDRHYVKGVLGDAKATAPALVATRPGTTVHTAKATRLTDLSPVTAAAPRPAVSSSTYADQVLALDPAGYWRLGEPSGTIAHDASAARGDGTYVDAVTLGAPGGLAGDPDTSAKLTGGYVSVPDSDPVSVKGAFTLEAWVNLDNVCNQYSLVEKYDAPAFNGYGLRVAPGGRLNAFNLAGQGASGSVTGTSVVTPHVWHHVVAVYDGTTIAVYLDGRRDGSAASTVDPTDGAATLKLGARGDDGATRLVGGLDEVAIYGRALTPEQIEQHYKTGTT